MTRLVYFFLLLVVLFFSSCQKDNFSPLIRHIQESDILIENNTVSLGFDRSTAISMGIPAYEYDAIVDLVKGANDRVKTKAGENVGEIQSDWILDDVIVLVYDQNNPQVDQYAKYYQNSFTNNDIGLEMRAVSHIGGSSTNHRLLVYSQVDTDDLTLNDAQTHYYRLFNISGPVTFVYESNLSGSIFIIVFHCTGSNN